MIPTILELNLGVREAQDAEVPGGQPSVPGRVMFGIVKRTVRLDHQPMSKADKVQNVGSERNLPPELQSVQAPVAQQLPQQAFGFGGVAA